MLSEKEILLKNKRDTALLAKKMAALLSKGSVVALYGQLGVGKTYFVNRLCHYMKIKDDVSSPSYVLLNCYQGSIPVFHYDLYRLQFVDEVFELGIEENYDRGITLIEWPEIAESILPENTWHFHFESMDLQTRKVLIVHPSLKMGGF